MKNRWLRAGAELRHHAPFTLLGAVIGILCMLLLKDLPKPATTGLFNIFHPAHVLLSAMITASLFKMRKGRTPLLTILLVGYLGSIGVATLSDCIVPFWGESIMGVSIPAHSHSHEDDGHDGHNHAADSNECEAGCEDHDHGDQAEAPHDEDAHQEDLDGAETLHDDDEHDHEAEHDHDHESELTGQAGACDHPSHKPELHLAFIEEWYIINPLAFLGILLAWFIPHERLHTKLPHTLHVLISTWASSFHILSNLHADFTVTIAIGSFIALFIAVWLPCCISDIVFPMLCVGEGKVPSCCGFHKESPQDAGESE